MAIIKRHWHEGLAALVAITLVMGSLLAPMFFQGEERAQAQSVEPEPPLVVVREVETYLQVQRLRGELTLGDRDLAAMGCSQERAEAVLAALVEWYAAHGQALHAAGRQEHLAFERLGDARRAIRIGPRDGSLIAALPTLREACATARAQRREVMASAAAAIDAALTSTEQEVWRAARRNVGAPARYRYVPDLTVEQARQLVAAVGARSTVDGSLFESEERVLSAVQSQQMAAAEIGALRNLAGVTAALERVLPTPAELVEHDQASDAEVDNG